MGGDSMGLSGAPSTALLEELNQKKALIASLEQQLGTASNSSRELETKLSSSQTNLTSADRKIKELEALLAQNKGGGGGDAAVQAELSMVTKERDEIRDRLKEFEIISDDLANLKRLQQENEQLKRSLAAQGGASIPEMKAPVDTDNIINQADVSDLLEDLGEAPAAASEDTQALEEFLSTPEEAIEPPAAEADTLAAMDEQAPEADKNKSDKTPEDLLSEFEKMLG
jgi:chromosome segregation ATPase